MGTYRHGFNIRSERFGVKRVFYDRWRNMLTRCHNPNRKEWKNYGGRGITVCKRWLDFRNFLQDMYPSFLEHFNAYGKKQTTLDRLNSDGNYEPNNCRWATKLSQARNTRTALSIPYNGKLYRVAEIASIFGRPLPTIYARIQKGIPLDKPYRKPRLPVPANKG